MNNPQVTLKQTPDAVPPLTPARTGTAASADTLTATPMQTLPQMLLAHARTRPQQLAQRVKRKGIWREYGFAHVLEQVRSLALGAAALGLARGDTAVVIGENEPEHYWAVFAAQSLGAKTVSVYPDATAEELHYLCADSGAKIIFAQDQEQVDKALAVAPRLPDIFGIGYWDDSGMWSYRNDLLHAFDALLAAGREEHRRHPRCRH